MRIVSQQECQEWLKTRLSNDFTWETVAAHYTHHVTYPLPIDTGKKTVLARILSCSFDTANPGLFWITGWGIFPSSENMVLFDGYRKSLGESRGVYETPGHIFDKTDLQQLESLLDLVLYFYWDAGLFDGAGNSAIRISHDEYICLYGKDRECLQKFEHSLECLKLKQLS